ncbi:hydrophobin [Crucibulum laeve]|uniref:Hydrophobin n=1 Tax=Crucibulum laeve TaxID=68775 RepID=A0A5C3LDV7_9AGAR|nr:hydrophobin [Crucibulum laeve]TFK32948.1 hydrophobin [Crucibulum laeve]
MQFKLSVATLALATLAAATPTRRTGGSPIPASQCTTGPVQCCNSTEAASGPTASKLLGLLGVVVQDLNVIVGITCTPITVIGVGGDSCTSQAVCCEDNSFHGVVAVGCTPVNLSL